MDGLDVDVAPETEPVTGLPAGWLVGAILMSCVSLAVCAGIVHFAQQRIVLRGLLGRLGIGVFGFFASGE